MYSSIRPSQGPSVMYVDRKTLLTGRFRQQPPSASFCSALENLRLREFALTYSPAAVPELRCWAHRVPHP